jgi:lipopolysaccharide/colanic/teichoic acid biosynthesis glycosyltransferase
MASSFIAHAKARLREEELHAAQFPERIGGPLRALLIAGDVAVTLFVSLIVFSSAPNWFAAGLTTTIVLFAAFWLCGLYKHSYAVTPRDEMYYACTGVIFAAVPALLILTLVGQIDAGIAAIALLLCAVGTSAFRVRLHLERRISTAETGIRSITPLAWHDRESPTFLLGKRTFDVIVASAALLLSFPIVLAAAIAIVLDSGFPVLFRQQRVGRNGRRFFVFKLRTMRSDAGAQWAQPGDRRITRIGGFLRRTSIDELPQLINVLRGDMSIVGPRPEMVEFAKRFAKELPNYGQRHAVPPGITGWAQMYCERNLTPEDVRRVLPCDLFYVQHARVVIDCALLMKTILEVLFQRAV